MGKPRGDLGSLVVPKATAAAAVPHAPAVPPVASPQPVPPPAPAPSGVLSGDSSAPKALTVKLDGPSYRRLRRYCQDQENTTGRAPTHQEVMVKALLAFLAETS